VISILEATKYWNLLKILKHYELQNNNDELEHDIVGQFILSYNNDLGARSFKLRKRKLVLENESKVRQMAVTGSVQQWADKG